MIRRIDMNVVILGILTKTAITALGVMGLLLAFSRRVTGGLPRQFLPLAALTPWYFTSPALINTRRPIDSPWRAPPGMTFIRQCWITGSGFC
ncbi:MAG: hypothetical protein ABSC42_15125 [Tepidisphaeraceae bacterium]